MLSQATSNHNLNIFSETNWKNQTHIWFPFYIHLRYCSLILKTWTTLLGLDQLYDILDFQTGKVLKLPYCTRLDCMIYQLYVTRIAPPWGKFHPWVEFAPVSGQTYLSVYMFNRGEISLLLLFHPCPQDRRETHPGDNSA